MPLFEVKMPDGQMQSFNPNWIASISADPNGGTNLELATRDREGGFRVIHVADEYSEVRNRIQTAFRESAGYK